MVDQYDTRRREFDNGTTAAHTQDAPQVEITLAHVPVPVDPIPDDVAIDPTCITFASAIPVDPDPANPSPVTIDDCTPAAYTPINCMHITIAYPMPTNSIPADSSPVVCIDTTDITPTEPVHVDPVSDTFPIRQALLSVSHAHLLRKFRTCIKDMQTGFVEFHFFCFFVFIFLE
jgi:hypothetical protein